MIRITALVFFMLTCQFGLSTQSCPECSCCKYGSTLCDSNKNCIGGCIDGYFGANCTEKCLKNCKTCVNGNECTYCVRGYYTRTCSIPCGKGCLENICSSISGECPCKSTTFTNKGCDACSGTMYGDECNKTCPSNCGSCISDTECTWCKNTQYYGPYCQLNCSIGCSDWKCNKVTGNCTGGCTHNYIGDKCDSCSPGLYGSYCDSHCTENCLSCLSATNCTVCKSGFYGETCTNTCPSGCYENCSFIDGKCLDCKPGFVGEFCNHTCKDGTYGVNCSKFCNATDPNCQVCMTDELGIYSGCMTCRSGHYPVISHELNYSLCITCSANCKDKMCNTTGLCSNGCLLGKWGGNCTANCANNCKECNQNDGKCLKCTIDTFTDDCSQNCSPNCNTTDNGRICARDTGKCLNGCILITKYGKYCDKQCSDNCTNQICEWGTGNCLEGCEMNNYGSVCGHKCADTCKSNDSKRICNDINGHCFFGCKDGFHGNRCDSNCSSQCINTTCNQITAECLFGCIDGFEGSNCVSAIKGAESDEKKPLVVIAGSTGAGFAVIVLLVLLVICLLKRKRRQALSSNTTCEVNDCVLDMKEIHKQNEEDEAGAIYSKPFKPKQQPSDDVGKESDTEIGDDKKMPAIDNGYAIVNIGASANKTNKTVEVCDTEHNNTCSKPKSGNHDYAVVNKGKSTVKEKESIDEVYDTTHANKKSKQPLHSNNDYAVLNVRSDNTEGFGKSKLTPQDDVYDCVGGKKYKTLSPPSNDHALFNDNNGDKHVKDKANTTYDTKSDKTLRLVNNDYDFCELHND